MEGYESAIDRIRSVASIATNHQPNGCMFAVEERVQEIITATQDAVASLNNTFKTKLVRLPKSVKGQKVSEILTETDSAQHVEIPVGNKKVKTEEGSYYNGKPLQTPMPFAGKAVPMPVTMLTMQQQGKRAGGKTKASRDEPRAAIVTTKDGKQWAIGTRGLDDIPESHRQEVADMLSSQFAFLRDALKTTL